MDITAGAAAAQTSEILLFKYLEDGGEITNAMCIAMKTSVTRGGMSAKAAKDLLGRIPSSYKAPSWGVPLARSKFHVKIENYPKSYKTCCYSNWMAGPWRTTKIATKGKSKCPCCTEVEEGGG